MKLSNVFKAFASAIALTFTFSVVGQVKVGNNPTTITPSAIFEVESTNKGVLLTRVALTSKTDAVTIASPATGLLVYNTATAGVAPNNIVPGYYYWDGSAWAHLSTTSSSSASSAWSVGEERSFMYQATTTNFNATGSPRLFMLGPDGTNDGAATSTVMLLSEAMTIGGGSISNALIINGLRLDFSRSTNAPKLVNTTSNSIGYSLVSGTTNGTTYLTGIKTTILGNAVSYFVVNNDALNVVTENTVSEIVDGTIVFSTGEWYTFKFFPLIKDGIVYGYTYAKRLL